MFAAIETQRAAEAAYGSKLASCQTIAEERKRAAEVEREGRREFEDDAGELRPVSYFIQHNVADALSRV